MEKERQQRNEKHNLEKHLTCTFPPTQKQICVSVGERAVKVFVWYSISPCRSTYDTATLVHDFGILGSPQSDSLPVVAFNQG